VWAFIYFFMPIADEPALNDVNRRDFLGLLALGLLVMIICQPKFITTVADLLERQETGDRR